MAKRIDITEENFTQCFMPTGDRILVKRDKGGESQTESGIYLCKRIKNRQTGVVRGCG